MYKKENIEDVRRLFPFLAFFFIIATLLIIFLFITNEEYFLIVAILPLVLLLIILILLHPEVGLYLIILSIPFDHYYIELSFFNISVTNILILVTLSSLLILFFTGKFKFLWDKNYIFLFLMFLAGIASIFVAFNQGIHIRSLITLIGCGLTYFLTVNIIRDHITLKKCLYVLGFAVITISIFGVLQSFFFKYFQISFLFGQSSELIGSRGGPLTRLFFPMSSVAIQDKNAFGFFLLTMLPAFVYLLFYLKNGWKRGTLFIATLIVAFALFVSYSRGAWIGFIASLAVIAVFLMKKHFVKAWPAISIILVFFIIILWFLGLNTVTGSVIEEVATLNIGAVNTRLGLWGVAWGKFAANPILGIGFGGFLSKYFLVAHNSYLQILVALGIVGTIPFILFLVRTITIAVKNMHKEYVFPLFACLIALLVASFTIDVFFSRSLWVILGLINTACILKEPQIC